tara:strand:- start:411 stop:875 length:465 start_codon:yes stop_codon:yes gene_type:complete
VRCITLPKVTYIGNYAYRKVPGTKELWVRRQTLEVTQEWLDTYRTAICTNPTVFVVEGDAKTTPGVGITVDEGGDGLPDAGWTKKDITGWLKEKGVTVTGYATKAKLLDKVKTALNPPAPEPVVEEVVPEPVAEEVVEETIVEDPIVEADGVEE